MPEAFDQYGDGWQPIETAPKNRRIRLWKPGNVPENGCEKHGKWNIDEYARTPRPYWDYEGLRITDSREHPPTHWMDVADAPDITF